MQPRFADHAWEDYLYWHEADRKQLKRINALIEDIRRHPFTGIGKPEPLKHQLAGFWSRRIDDRHRLGYAVEGGGRGQVFHLLIPPLEPARPRLQPA